MRSEPVEQVADDLGQGIAPSLPAAPGHPDPPAADGRPGGQGRDPQPGPGEQGAGAAGREGDRGLIHRSRGRPSNRRIRPHVEARAKALLRQKYHDFGPTLASEHLAEDDAICLGRTSVTRLMHEEHLLAAISRLSRAAAAKRNCRLYIINENEPQDTQLVRPTEQGGYGLDALWNDDFHHSVHTLLTGEDKGYYRDFGEIGQMAKAIAEGFVYSGQYSEFRKRRHGNSSAGRPPGQLVVFSQNHDQVGNRAFGDRIGMLADEVDVPDGKVTDFKRAVERVFRLNSSGSPFYTDIVGAAEFAKSKQGGISGIVTDEQGAAWDVRFFDYASPASGEWFPRIVEVRRGGELLMRFTGLRADNKSSISDKLF